VSKLDDLQRLRAQKQARLAGRASSIILNKEVSHEVIPAPPQYVKNANHGSNGRNARSAPRPQPSAGEMADGAIQNIPVQDAEPRVVEPAGRTAGSNPATGAKRGRGRPKIKGKRPWELQGISRRTYYRRKQKAPNSG
jgi:hypothetical protein